MDVPASFDDAFSELYRAAYRAAHRVLGSATGADDAASEALARAAMRWRRVADHALPWVVRVATNLAIDQVRRDARGSRAMADRSDEGAGQPSADAVDLQRALAALPRRQREVVTLRYFGDLSEAEIASELGMAPGTVKSHASRGLAALRAHLDPSDATNPAAALRTEEVS